MTGRTTLCLALTAALGAAACLPQEERSQREEIRRALPTADGVRINLPEGNAQQFSLGQVSETFLWTRGISLTFNAGAAWVLIVVHAVVQLPPTSVQGNTYVWGPHSRALDPAEWRLTVVDNLDGTYSWDLEGRSKTDPQQGFLSLVAGLAVPGEEPHRGSGNFSIDFDNSHAVNPIDNPDTRGSIDVEYDLENRFGTAATIRMHIDTVDDGGEPVVADYHYGENSDGSGDLVFSFRADVDDNGSLEDARIRSRWRADGAGRSDVTAEGESQTIVFSQCWDTQFRTVFEDLFSPSGDPDACAFTEAELPDA